MATAHYENDCRDGFDDSHDPHGSHDPHDSHGAGLCSQDLHQGGSSPGEKTFRKLSAHRRLKMKLHRISEVRHRQGVTLRNVARRLGLELSVVRRQEESDCDLRLTDLLLWQEVLEVPVGELLVEAEGQLSGPILERARMVKLMKTAAAIRERAGDTPVGRLVGMLVSQILEIMPELENVTPWHTVGQRRTLDELGRVAQNPVQESLFRNENHSY